MRWINIIKDNNYPQIGPHSQCNTNQNAICNLPRIESKNSIEEQMYTNS